MIKLRFHFVAFLLFLFLSSLTTAQPSLNKNIYKPSKINITYRNKQIIFTNITNRTVNLQNAVLELFSHSKSLNINASQDPQAKFTVSSEDYSTISHSLGNFFRIKINFLSHPLLKSGEVLKLNLNASDFNPHGLTLFIVERVPVQVQVTASNLNWVETISICNTSATTIPLTDVEFNFTYAKTMPTNIWGQPWTAWKLASQQGNQVVLLGGTPWTPPLPPDPNCTNPLTIQFNASPDSPAPMGPFVFKAAGGQPSSVGGLTITLQNEPAANVTTPQVNVQGMGKTLQQAVNWGTQWKLTDLVPGSYAITGTMVDNSSAFYQAKPMTVNVMGQTTTQAILEYEPVPTTQVTVTLMNAPGGSAPLTLTGKNFSFKRTVNASDTISLPADTYTVSSIVAGYSAIINPNPLVVPTNTTLSINYQQSMGARFVGYFDSSIPDSQIADGTKTNLANLPSYVNIVNLAFMKPDAIYLKGSMSYSGTGLSFNYQNASVFKNAISALHQKNPGTRVLVSIGGANYTNWGNLNAQAIADFVVDFGLDGIDINYAPATTGCALGSDNLIHCQIDAAFESYVESLRTMLPRPYLLSVTSFNVGAFGQDQWRTAQPQNQYTGIMLPLLRSVSAKDIDTINVMSYDGGPSYSATQALAAYSNYYPGPITMGVEVPPEAWGGHVYNLCEVTQLVQAVKASASQHNNTAPGMMLWSLQKKPTGTATPSNPNAQMIATTICTSLGLSDCNQPLLINGFTAFQMPNLNKLCI